MGKAKELSAEQELERSQKKAKKAAKKPLRKSVKRKSVPTLRIGMVARNQEASPQAG